ncbi:hypothetical protein HPB49_025904 [Dermacentor silvarum]|nr:hypothetical protein HPB49_025904 [Dermacentor silvarum]
MFFPSDSRAQACEHDPKVSVEVFYETYCPDSRNFVLEQLNSTYAELPNIVQLQLVPYGKASRRELPNKWYSFDCQHGDKECYGNLLQPQEREAGGQRSWLRNGPAPAQRESLRHRSRAGHAMSRSLRSVLPLSSLPATFPCPSSAASLLLRPRSSSSKTTAMKKEKG